MGVLARALVAAAFLFAAAAPVPAADAANGRSAPAAAENAPAPAAGAGKAGAERRAPARRDESAVVVFNRAVADLRAPFLGMPASERADTASRRIATLLERGGPGAVSLEELASGMAVKIDGAYAFLITHDDVDRLGGEVLATVASDAKRALERAIAETQEARSGRLLLAASAWAGGATVVYVVLLALLRIAGRALSRRMMMFAGRTVEEVRIGGTSLLRRDRALRVVRWLARVGYWAIAFLLTYEWLGYVLGRFPYTRPWGEQLHAFLVDTGAGIVLAMAKAIPDLLVAAAIFFLARGVTGMLAGFFDNVQSGRVRIGWLDADSARPTRRLAAFAVWVFALVMAYPYIPGSDTEAFKGLSVLLGLMVSLGASSIVGQAASGLILMYTRTFRPGEYVRVGDHEGTVVEMGMFTTRVRTGLGEELSLPNAMVLGTVSKNYSRAVVGHGFVLDAAVTIGYDAPWRQVHAMLAEAARRTEGVLADPAPRVFQTALSDFYVEYRLVCQAVQAEPRPRAAVLSSLHANVQDVFNEHGVQIMSPHYLGDPAQAKVVPKERWYEAPAMPDARPRA